MQKIKIKNNKIFNDDGIIFDQLISKILTYRKSLLISNGSVDKTSKRVRVGAVKGNTVWHLNNYFEFIDEHNEVMCIIQDCVISDLVVMSNHLCKKLSDVVKEHENIYQCSKCGKWGVSDNIVTSNFICNNCNSH